MSAVGRDVETLEAVISGPTRRSRPPERRPRQARSDRAPATSLPSNTAPPPSPRSAAVLRSFRWSARSGSRRRSRERARTARLDLRRRRATHRSSSRCSRHPRRSPQRARQPEHGRPPAPHWASASPGSGSRPARNPRRSDPCLRPGALPAARSGDISELLVRRRPTTRTNPTAPHDPVVIDANTLGDRRVGHDLGS